MPTNEFSDFLTYLTNKKILITTHDLVDIDGLASSYVLKYFLNQYFENQQVSIIFSDLSKLTKGFMRKFCEKFLDFNFFYEKSVNMSNFNVCLILDTNKTDQTALDRNLEMSGTKIPIIFIDHHFLEEKKKIDALNPINLIFEKFTSTAEIILELLEKNNIKLTLPMKYLIVAAILTDTGYFRYGNNRSIKNVCKLLNNDIDIQDLNLLLETDVELSEKIAKIKGLQRVRLYRKGDYLIGITNVGSYGSNVASMLIKVGFDIGIVHSKEKLESIITIRAKKNLCLRTGLHVGKILEQISKYCEGSGGGHDGAASLTCKKEVKNILDKILDRIKHVLNQ
jgi:nanoRNase/pAp phosphatase (c-di-AMP/oligoRNAs hydrolase)